MMSIIGKVPAAVMIRLPVYLNGASIGLVAIPFSSRTRRTNFRCSSGIRPASSSRSFPGSIVPVSAVLAGRSTSTPYGFPPLWLSIQSSSVSSSSTVWDAAPNTPKPPRRLTSATTSRQWLNAKIGYSIPNSDAIVAPIDTLLSLLADVPGWPAIRLTRMPAAYWGRPRRARQWFTF
jgi:hypothetical protein